MKLIEQQAAKVASTEKSSPKTLRRHSTRYGLELTLGRAWQDNVFKGSDDLTEDDFGPQGSGDFDFSKDDLRQDAFFTVAECSSFLDVPLGRKFVLKNELSYSLDDYDSLDVANRRKFELETELHYFPAKGWNAYVAGQVSRRLYKGSNELGTEYDSDYDYYRYEFYTGVEKRLTPLDSLEFQYRRNTKNYNETPGLPSKDYDEDRFAIDWEHRFTKKFRGILTGEYRRRSYDEMPGRDRFGDRIPDEIRSLDIYVAKLDFYWKIRPGTKANFGLQGKFYRDPFEHYYDYDGARIELEVEQRLPMRFYLLAQGSYDTRDYELQRFLEYGPDPRIEDYAVARFQTTLGYNVSEWYRLELKYERKEVMTNVAIEDYSVNTVIFQMVFKLTPSSTK